MTAAAHISQPHIVVVDDDAKVRGMLRRYLTGEGFRVSEATDGSSMRSVLQGDPADLILLDLVMPGEDGFSLARAIRQRESTPIIMLTGKGDLIDKVAGLEAGADDYIAKPFHLREVLARIRTVLRRTHAEPTTAIDKPSHDKPPCADLVLFEGWRFDTAKRELTRRDGTPVRLTTGEFNLLQAFVLNANRVLNRDVLMDLVKGREWAAFDRTIDAQVVRLRKKIESDPAHPTLIKTVRGAGYIFAAKIGTP